ncbi:MAG: PEPxxWA-CTERM sorting domain-containing protein [Sandaracinobacteroides sp.]
MSEARIKDTVFFSNTSGGVVYLPFSFSFDGSITDPNDFGANATSILSLAGAIGTCPNGTYGGCFGDYSYKLQNGGSPNQTTVIGYAGNGSQNGVQQGGAFFFNAPDNVDLTNYTVLKDWNQGGGYYNTVVSSVLALPEGASRIGFDLRVIIDCWVYPGAQCDFTQTSKFAFGDPQPGLSYTSASGVFMVRSPDTPGAIPEPVTWAMLIAGFAMVGAAARRRRSALAQA